MSRSNRNDLRSGDIELNALPVSIVFLISVVEYDQLSSDYFASQDPDGHFELIEVVGTGTYGNVWKVRFRCCADVFR